ncbi:MAG: hypothetical protein JNK61_00255 [Bacteroidia bacterium]|mgnify:CR=1 FL=1|nr:hypothetical protein [Bacteroidia bacterium]HQV00968.1 hypothetical protein [Bacteroidia bacterium]
MQNNFIQYLKYATIVMLLAMALVWIVTRFVMHQPQWFQGFWGIPVFYFLLYAGFHYGALLNTEGKAFVRYYMVASFLKLLLLVAIIVGYALFNKENARGFAINFLLSYFVFMAFEVYYLRKHFGSR